MPAAAETEERWLAQQDAIADTQTLTWSAFSLATGQFTVEMPGAPIAQNGTSELLGYTLDWQLNSVLLPAVDEADLFEYYAIAHTELPPQLIYEASQEEILDEAVAGLVAEFDDEDFEETLAVEEIAFHNLPARLLTAEGFGQFFVANVAIANERLYVLLAIDDDADNFERFYESFSLFP